MTGHQRKNVPVRLDDFSLAERTSSDYKESPP